MIIELIHPKLLPSIMTRMFKTLFLLLALTLVNIPIAVRASVTTDSCCGQVAQSSGQVQLSLPDPTRLVSSDMEITKQLMDREKQLLKPLSVSTVSQADDQIHIQFFLEAMQQSWKINSNQSDITVDISFRLKNLSYTGDAAAADLEIQHQFQKEFM